MVLAICFSGSQRVDAYVLTTRSEVFSSNGGDAYAGF